MRLPVLSRPLIIFDLETTGLNHAKDKIIQLAAIKLWPGDDIHAIREAAKTGAYDPNEDYWKRRIFSTTINPEVPVHEDILELTGLDLDIIQRSPTFKEYVIYLKWFFLDSFDPLQDMDYGSVDYGGYNSNNFDIPFLVEEFKRAGELDFCLDDGCMVDAVQVFHKMEPRDLAAAYKFYVGEEMENAHNAIYDVDATLAVIVGQLNKYEEMPNTVCEMELFGRRENQVDRHNKFSWNKGEVCFNFGKHKGEPLKDIVAQDKGWIRWAIDADFPTEFKRILIDAQNGIYPNKPETKEDG